MEQEKKFWANPYSDGGWAVQKSQYGGTISKHSSQRKAWKEARRLACAEGTDALLQNRNGKVVTKSSYICNIYSSEDE